MGGYTCEARVNSALKRSARGAEWSPAGSARQVWTRRFSAARDACLSHPRRDQKLVVGIALLSHAGHAVALIDPRYR